MNLIDDAKTSDDCPISVTSAPWYYRKGAIFLLLMLLYPVGIVLWLKNPKLKPWQKVAGTVVFAPIFCLLVLLALKPFWDFAGGLRSLRDFSLDFSRLTHSSELEDHRRLQKTAQSAVALTSADDARLVWTDFRGSRRDGVCEGTNLELDWTNHPPRELWRQPVGDGYASFVVGAGRAYTIEQRRKKEAVTCYDFTTGRELWVYDYDASFEEVLGGDGPRATPTLVGDRLYALGAQGHLHGLDTATGKALWKRNILQEFDQENLSWGLSGSPLVIDGTVLVTNSGKPGPSVLAYDATNGNPLWKTDAGVQAYSSLVVMTIAGRRQVLNLAAAALNSLDPGTGEILWSFPWTTDMGINCSQPLNAGDDRVFLSSGYSKGCALIKIESIDGKLQARELWSNRRMKNKFNSSLLHGGFIYGLDEGVLGCLNLETGERRWKGGRYEYGSLLFAQGHLFVLSENGQLAVVEAKPDEYRELATLSVLKDKTWNNFVLVGGRLLTRNHKEMAMFDLRSSARTAGSFVP